MRRTIVVCLVALSIALALPSSLAATRPKPCVDRIDGVAALSIPMRSGTATGFYAFPSTTPKGLVVFSHGYGHSSYSWKEHLRRVAKDLGVVTVAMDGRGLTFLDEEKAPGIPETRGWPVQAAAEDGIAAVRHFQRRCPTPLETVVNYGVSMGGNTAGLMATVPGLFDWWIDVEGATTMSETYAQAKVLALSGNETAVNAVADMEKETGGTPDGLQSRTVLRHVPTIAKSGVKGVVVIQGVDDGLVTYDQSQQLQAALRAVGVPVHYFTVTLRDEQSEKETTASGHVAGRVDKDYRSPLVGHASERSTTHIVSRLGFERLYAIFGGVPPACHRAYVVADGRTSPEVSPCLSV